MTYYYYIVYVQNEVSSAFDLCFYYLYYKVVYSCNWDSSVRFYNGNIEINGNTVTNVVNVIDKVNFFEGTDSSNWS